MKTTPSLLILYSPYYQKEVIEQHIRILLSSPDQQNAQVAYGKIRSKFKDHEHPYWDELLALSESVSPDSPLHLFLTDFSSLHVAKVVKIFQGASQPSLAPGRDKSGRVQEGAPSDSGYWRGRAFV